MEVANTLAYYDIEAIASVKSFIVQAPRIGSMNVYEQCACVCTYSEL
jgi:hypothetical protein